ncbi:hypothetical protein CYMTET_37672 [Cymbomonas tetramitiformis]|uniref:Deacetylase sirtuin-type domain-containing protein n=1 Tax=Cymbomonas tetramitiformis TaxID=36881 RepID=A0AAE0CFU7_9CHLO|nr:hypothetical protein CYMTET_37672 [Cymbomonas tetramitiformis]|eukprot:gene5292-6434_t
MPKRTWVCDKPPRDDHSSPSWLTATEFQDENEVAMHKCRQLANLLRCSKRTVLYTGAGISAAVVGQAARSGMNKVGWKPNKMTATPTYTHYALGFLGKMGVIHSWVQQNHDGLPQKAGFPQGRINEVHGSWYNPSNPVVKYNGNLHHSAYEWMRTDTATADLVIVLGSSLGGLNADQVATNAADRSLSTEYPALGSVLINLQQTPQDGCMTLRFFEKSDTVLKMLLFQLGLMLSKPEKYPWTNESRVLVGYDVEGRRLPPESKEQMWLDLREGARVKITEGHNIQGAKQPQYMHIGAKKPVNVQGVSRKPGLGLGRVIRREDESGSFLLDIDGATMRLGIWWLDSAARGEVDMLPIVNQTPSVVKLPPLGSTPVTATSSCATGPVTKAKTRPACSRVKGTKLIKNYRKY